MSLKYGLNLGGRNAPPPPRKTILDDEPDEEDEAQENADDGEDITTFGRNAAPPPSRKNQPPPPSGKSKPLIDDRRDLSSTATAQKHISAASEVDPSIFDYDSFHAAKSSAQAARQAAARQDAIDRKPKYINNLLDAAARRKQDQLVAKEKALQREREQEGDEFADKEKFVTGAYKAVQEEARKVEEEEKRKAEQEEKRRGGGMQGFYRNMMEERERVHREALEAAEKIEKEGVVGNEGGEVEKSEAEMAEELRRKGVDVHVNEDGAIVDKRELLSAGLNVGKRKDGGGGADHLRTSARPAQNAFVNRNDAGKQAQRERQSRMVEEQIAAAAKRQREEEEEERVKLEKAAKSTKTEKDVSDAKARYLARKAAKERGEG